MDPKSGLMLRACVFCGSGAQVDLVWKTWVAQEGDPVATSSSFRWELRRILPAFGYDMSSKHGRLCLRLRDMKWRWLGVIDHLKLDRSEHYGESRHSAILRQGLGNEGDAAPHEQEYWASILLVLLLLLDMRISARTASRQDTSEVALRTFLQATVDAGFANEFGIKNIPDGIVDLCTKDVDDCRCGCLRAWSASVPRERPENATPQHALCQAVCGLFEFLGCPTLSSWLKAVLLRIVAHVESRSDAWATDTTWYKSKDVALVSESSQRRRRLDYHAKQYFVKEAVAAGKASTSSAAARSMEGVSKSQVGAWKEQEMAAQQASVFLSFNGCEAVACTYDAARLGQPAQEVLVSLARNLDKRVTATLPPQDHVGAPSGPNC